MLVLFHIISAANLFEKILFVLLFIKKCVIIMIPQVKDYKRQFILDKKKKSVYLRLRELYCCNLF